MIHSFTFELNAFGELTGIENSLYESGCDDALLAIRSGRLFLSFDRDAESLEEAIESARRDVHKCKNVEVIKVILCSHSERIR